MISAPHGKNWWWGLGLFGAVSTLTVGSIVSAGIVPANTVTTMTSSNWAGYANVASSGAFSAVSGEWTVPTVSASASANGSYASFWVGLDGYGSSTVEQIGIGAGVSSGTAFYYAWYEMYPTSAYELPIQVAAGNAITASVTYVGNNKYDLLINDLTSGQSYSTVQTSSSGQRSSAEWIAEAPSGSSGVLPLANFGTVAFSDASVTMDGTTGSISSFSADAISLVSSSGLGATTSALNSSGTGFSVTTGADLGSPGPSEPEPSTLALLGLAGLVLTCRRRRRTGTTATRKA